MRAQVSVRVRAEACDFGATRGFAMRRLKPFAAIWPVRPEDCQRASSVTERLTGRALGASRKGAHGSGWGPAGGEQELRRHRDGVDEWEGSGRAEGHAAAAAAADGCRRAPRGSRHLYTLCCTVSRFRKRSRGVVETRLNVRSPSQTRRSQKNRGL